ncbi:unnamed protein product [Lymnaea stagnalis]|uniref:DNA helicase B winged helix domain-containing protein n=1 Tax=Lymnaea stagnalis TaxID=6523 RepID=A0AAV2I4M7_LYMST
MAASRSLQNTRSKQHKIVKGIFQLPYKSKNDTVHGNDSDSSEEEEEFDDISLYFGNNNNFVSSKIPKEVKVVITSEDGRSHNCTGKFPLTQVFWQVEALVDSRGFLRPPPAYTIIKDDEIVRQKNLVNIFLSECFSILKEDEERENAVKACFEAFCQITGEDKNLSFANLENILTQYLRFEKCGCCLGKITITNIRFGNHQQEDHSVYIKNHVMGSELGSTVLLSASHPKLVRTCSQLLPYTFMPFLFRLRDISVTNTVNPTELIELADKMARERPWEYAFKDILASKLKIYGTEAKRQFYEQAGYLERTPQTEKDAIYIYDVLKEDSKRNGNMCIGLKIIRRSNLFGRLHYNISSTKRWSDALDYLERNNVIKIEEFNFDRHIFLRENWQAEVDTAKGFDTILKKYKKDPLVWDIDLHSPEFARICKDPDQLRASHLICHLPVTVLSGRGGCGKTTVVTKLLQHLCPQNKCEVSDLNKQGSTISKAEELIPNSSLTAPTNQKFVSKLEKIRKELVSDLVKILENSRKVDDLGLIDFKSQFLLTAPTGKAARLLGCKAKLPSTTLHSVIMSWRMYSKKNTDPEFWNYAGVKVSSAGVKVSSSGVKVSSAGVKVSSSGVNVSSSGVKVSSSGAISAEVKVTFVGIKAISAEVKVTSVGTKAISAEVKVTSVLVVDECSLVSVRLFATVLKILLEKANLQKIILLGDVRQLPSIEPGEFLKDVFKTLHSCGHGEFGLSVELRQNHRSESALIVKNAGKVSNQVMPTFDPAQRFHLIEISDRGDDGERDQKIRGLLRNAQDVTSDVESQFVSFRNAHCKAVNELCCMHYNGHSITTSQTGRRKVRLDFQIGDKICLGKNNLVTNSRSHIIDKYLKEDPEFQKAFKEAQQKLARQDKRSVCTASHSLSGLKLNKTVLDDTRALNLILGDDETFNTTIDKMREDDLRVEENRAELEKIERRKRAEMKKAEWTAQRVADESLIGEDSEKLCNGEVFFIMDEFNEVDKNGKHIKYFVLSDRDPELPRVVCVPFKQLKGNCKMKHSWARTIHTYQGSESGTVVYVLGQAMPQNWQHVYTAITRGKNSVYIVGSHAQLLTAINRREQIRLSRLRHRLKEALLQNMECIEMCRQKFVTSYQPESTSDFSFDSEQWSESMLLQLEEKVEIEADVNRLKDEKEATADTNLEMIHCDAKDSLFCKSPTTQSDDPNTKMSADVNAGISSDTDTTLDHEFHDDESELELMMANDKAQMVNEVALNGSPYKTELSQCGLQDPNKRIGKLSTDVQLSSSANQMISNDPEHESSDSENEYRIFESVSRSKARQIREKLCSPCSLSGPSRPSSAPKRLSLKSSTDFSLSPKHEVSRPYLNVTPPRSSPVSTEKTACLTSPPKRACVDTPFRDSFTSSMSLHDDHDDEVEDGDESPRPRKTPNVCRKL